MDEGGQMGGSKVNFQKASCTLDASVKIYSHRYGYPSWLLSLYFVVVAIAGTVADTAAVVVS